MGGAERTGSWLRMFRLSTQKLGRREDFRERYYGLGRAEFRLKFERASGDVGVYLGVGASCSRGKDRQELHIWEQST